MLHPMQAQKESQKNVCCAVNNSRVGHALSVGLTRIETLLLPDCDYYR